MTLRLMGTCYGGKVSRAGSYKHPVSGRMETGVYEVPCPACQGTGCPTPEPKESKAALHAAVRQALAD